MSKVVKGIGRAVSSVVKGVVNVVKDVAKSKLGKILITAAAIYFGGAALMGGFSASAAGGGFLTGASAGLSGAASGVSTAWGSLMAGEIGAAGSALSSGFTGAGAAGAATVAPSGLVTGAIAPNAFVGGAPTTMANGLPFNPSDLQVTDYIQKAAGNSALTTPPTSFMGNMMSSPYAAPAAIMSGTQLIGGAMQGYGAQQEAKRQEKMSEDARALYNKNINTRLFS